MSVCVCICVCVCVRSLPPPNSEREGMGAQDRHAGGTAPLAVVIPPTPRRSDEGIVRGMPKHRGSVVGLDSPGPRVQAQLEAGLLSPTEQMRVLKESLLSSEWRVSGLSRRKTNKSCTCARTCVDGFVCVCVTVIVCLCVCVRACV